MNHPDFFFGHSFENAIINFQNPYVLRVHLLCAALELALTQSDAVYFGENLVKKLAELANERLLKERQGRYFLAPALAYPGWGRHPLCFRR